MSSRVFSGGKALQIFSTLKFGHWGVYMLIKHKISLLFLAILILVVAAIAMEFYQNIYKAEYFAEHEATAIAQTMAFNLSHHSESNPSSSAEIETAFQRSIEQFKKRQKRDIFVVDINKKIVADAIEEEIGNIFNYDPDNEVGLTLLDGKSRTFEEKNYMHPEGIKLLAIPLDASSGNRIGALVLEYTPLYNDILAGIKESTATQLIIYSVILSIALTGGYVFVRNLSRPLRDMRNAAKEVAEGREGVRISYSAPDELGELAASFNKMAEDVAGFKRDLLEANEQLKSDIEKRKMTEEALVASEQRLRALLDAIPDMILFKDTEGCHLLANKAATDAFGGPENLLGKTVEDLLPPNSAEACRENDEEVMRSHQLYRSEESMPDKQGNEMTIDTIRVPLYDSQKNPTGLVVIVRDITEKKQAEESLLASLREKEVLLREIHHRVKNNLTVIISLLRLHSNKIESEDLRNIFIESQNRIRAMALVHEKLYSERKLSEVNFESYVRKLASDICGSLKVSRSLLKTDFEIENIFLDTDTLIPCGLIINELITNALKHAFADQDSPEINIGLTTLENGRLKLSVADNGSGIPAEIDIHNCESLGLLIVKSLVEQIHGNMDVIADGGTRFDIYFPKEVERSNDT